MEISTYFFKDICLFGPYPTQRQADALEALGVKYFIDLTTPSEKITRYQTRGAIHISYPIRDNYIPESIKLYIYFLRRLVNLIRQLKPEEKIFIHCKGGHGRSGMVVASLLCILENLKSQDSIFKTTQYHSIRPTLKDKWVGIDCPNMKIQKDFIKKLFD